MLSKDFRTLGCVLGTQTPCLKKKLKNCVGCRYFIYSVKDLGAGSTFGIAKNAEKIPIPRRNDYKNRFLAKSFIFNCFYIAFCLALTFAFSLLSYCIQYEDEILLLLSNLKIFRSLKVPIDKDTVSPSVMYRCESWTLKKADC